MAKRRKKILLSATLVTAVCLALYFLLVPREPIYSGERIGYWFSQLGSTNEPQAHKALAGIDAAAVPFLINKALKRDSALLKTYAGVWNKLPAGAQQSMPQPYATVEERALAFTLLKNLGGDAWAGLPELFKALDNPEAAPPPNTLNSFHAAPHIIVMTIDAIDGKNPDTLHALLERAAHADIAVRHAVCWKVATSDPILSDPALYDEFLNTIHRELPRIEDNLLMLLAERIVPNTELNIEKLVRMLAFRDSSVICVAAAALSEAESHFEIIVPALIASAGDKNYAAFHPYKTSVGKNWGQAHNPFVRPGQLPPTPYASLAQLHQKSDLVMPKLIEALDSDNSHLASGAAGTLASMGEDARPALPKLRSLANSENDKLRYHVAEALWRIDKNPEPLIPFRIEALREPKLVKGTQWGYIGFLGTHAARHPAAIETIAHMLLTAEDFTVRAHAANVLEEMGPAARPALPQLRRAALDEWLTVRDAATNAIVRIETEGIRLRP